MRGEKKRLCAVAVQGQWKRHLEPVEHLSLVQGERMRAAEPSAHAEHVTLPNPIYLRIRRKTLRPHHRSS